MITLLAIAAGLVLIVVQRVERHLDRRDGLGWKGPGA